MATIAPVVRHMLLCEEVRQDSNQPGRVSIDGLITTIRSLDDPPFPLRFPRFAVYLMFTGGRGTGTVSVAVRFADTGALVAGTQPRPLTFGPDPLAVEGVVFNVLDCRFSEPGVYWVQFVCDGQVLAQEPLTVR